MSVNTSFAPSSDNLIASALPKPEAAPVIMTTLFDMRPMQLPLPFLNYSATVQLLKNEHNTTTVEWTGTFEPRGIEESQAKTLAYNMYSNAINGARLELESN